jgi:hypothetical protein
MRGRGGGDAHFFALSMAGCMEASSLPTRMPVTLPPIFFEAVMALSAAGTMSLLSVTLVSRKQSTLASCSRRADAEKHRYEVRAAAGVRSA